MEPHRAEPAEVVVVRLGGCRYALPLEAVAEVGRPPALTRVPGLPGWVAGVANWRGRVLAVLDLRPLLQAPVVPLQRGARLVVITSGTVRVGLLCEAVDGTVPLRPGTVEPVLPHLAGSAGPLLCGQVTGPDGPVGVVDVAAVVRLSGGLPRGRRAA